MSKLNDEKGKQTKLSSFFSALNNNNKSSDVKKDNENSLKSRKNEGTIEISDDDKTPIKFQLTNDLKENLIKLSNEMDNNKPSTGKFSFRSKSNSNKTEAQPSNNTETAPINISRPKEITNVKKNQFAYIDNDDSLDDILPLSMSTKTSEIKPQPLFKISTKSTKSSETAGSSSLFKLKPKFTSTQKIDKTLQEEREKSILVSKTQNVKPKNEQIVELDTKNSTSSERNSLLSPSSSKFSFRKSKASSVNEPIKYITPTKQPESIKIGEQLSSTIKNELENFSPPISSKIVTSNDNSLNSSTPELKVEYRDLSFNKSPNDKCTSKINGKIETGEVIEDIEKTTTFMDEYDLQQIKNEKLKFLEIFFTAHNSVPLAVYDSLKDYNKTLTVRLKGIIQSLDRRQKIKENDVYYPKSSTKSIPTKSAAYTPPSYINDDDQFDIDQIMADIEDEKKREVGKFNNSYVDITNDSFSNNMPSKFTPRIDLKESMPAKPTVSNIFNDHLETDDDGFPIIDYTQLEDVLPSPPKPSTSSARQTKSTESLKASKKDTVDSMIPDNISEITIKSSSSIGTFHSSVKNDGITGEFDRENHEFSLEMRYAFRSTFGLKKFRQNQLQAINASLLGHDCFILMPTGGGKSLCYQLPAIISKGVTIVISPLKSLILDQVNKLKSLDIKAAAMSGDISQTEIKSIYSDLNQLSPSIKLLYVTPEKISASSFFQDTLTSLHLRGNLARIVIDEAHVISCWGHDFRPDYKRLGELKKRFPSVPIIALTATANERVRRDVVHQLGIYSCKWFLSSFNRPNLKYIVTQKTGVKTVTDIINLIKSKFQRSSGIIYCLSRKECDQVAQKLQLVNIPAISYHAGMTDKSREKAQEDWITDKYRVVCATIAFGMGIDKPDVRFVIHYSMPKSIEGYYQESGRAGRDGGLSTCILYYCYGDKMRYVNMLQNEPQAVRQVSMNNLDLVVNFCENMLDCRRTLQLNYFGEHFAREQCLENRPSACDNCTRAIQYKNIDVTDKCKTLVSAVADLCARNGLTVLQLVDVFKGAMTKKVTECGHHNTRFHGCLKDWERTDIQRILHKLIIENYLREEITVIRDIPISYVKVGKKVAQLMNHNEKIEFAILEKRYQGVVSKKVDVATSNDEEHNTRISELQDRCYQDLMAVARTIADERNLTIQQVMNMEALRQMSIVMPETEAEMLQIPHVTKANFNKYGQKFLTIIIPYSAQRSVYEMDREAEIAESLSEETGSQDWDELGREASTSSGATRGFKRKSASNWGKVVNKKFKSRSFTKKKTKSPKRKSSAAKKKNLMPAPRPTF